jgi:hypothetical protein
MNARHLTNTEPYQTLCLGTEKKRKAKKIRRVLKADGLISQKKFQLKKITISEEKKKLAFNRLIDEELVLSEPRSRRALRLGFALFYIYIGGTRRENFIFSP